MKKHILTFILFFSSAVFVYGQQTAQYSNYLTNYFAMNPALAGSNDCLNVKLGYRNQWVGFTGAPKTTFATFSTEIKHKKIKTIRTKHGFGALIENDEIGPFSRSTIYLSYAYHFPVGRSVTASVGVFGGLTQMGVDATQINIVDVDDPLINGTGRVYLVPDISPGMFLNHDDWFLGYSIRQIMLNKWTRLIGSNSARNRFHHYFVGGKRFKTESFNLVPSTLVKFVGFSKPSIDLNLMAELSKKFEIGVSWRNTDAIIAMLNLKFLKFFSLGYAFDMTTSKVNIASSNTHEFILGLSACPFNEKSTYVCPLFQ